ncbi:hypothetical protein K458DRAFT_428495 [Lentithecium fluviatile CBS 122367]|uniref:Uncharacterized protein n=1 Tax=Lentithecium fluviatile CBS 122367 TaxID=1168545 RepID=A0A6G1JBV5_9PLEO|nr:hypothetical protein K458DRAFT_428495 [Lentithecium fluviatile CBS 122367]
MPALPLSTLHTLDTLLPRKGGRGGGGGGGYHGGGSGSGEALSTGEVIAIVVGVIVGCLIILAIWYYCKNRERKAKGEEERGLVGGA